MDQPSPEYESDLVDLTDARFREVLAMDESALGHALRRLQREADDPDELVAGYSEAI